MPTFVEPPVKSVKYKNAAPEVVNDVVNLDLCKRIAKRFEPMMYNVELPVLIFVGCDTKWFFYSVKERDDALSMILNLKTL